jgi:hypothetical protein
MSDNQNAFIEVLSKYLNDIKDESVSDYILNERINGCTEELIKLLLSKCSDQVKDNLPE